MIGHIAYASDENYVKLLAVSIKSLLENNPNIKLEIFIFDCGIESSSKEEISRIVNSKNSVVNWIDLDCLLSKASWPINDVYSNAIYARLFLDEIPERVKRILYLDSDTIINGDISDLMLQAFDDRKVIIGRAENEEFCSARDKELCQSFKGKYINSGVLLIDLDKWRSEQYGDKLAKFLGSYEGVLSFPDQDAINLVCKERIDSTMCYTYNANLVRGGGVLSTTYCIMADIVRGQIFVTLESCIQSTYLIRFGTLNAS